MTSLGNVRALVKRRSSGEVISSNNRDKRNKLRWLICPNPIRAQTAERAVTRGQKQDRKRTESAKRWWRVAVKRTRVASTVQATVQPSLASTSGAIRDVYNGNYAFLRTHLPPDVFVRWEEVISDVRRVVTSWRDAVVTWDCADSCLVL